MQEYKIIHIPNHPNATKDGDIREHRLVASQKLGRPLKPEEVVHHIDKNKKNNDPDNLMVFSTKADHTAFHMGHKLIDNGDGTYSAEFISKEELIRLLEKYEGHGVIKAVAKELNVNSRTVYCYYKEYNICINKYIRYSKEKIEALLNKYKGYGVIKAVAKELNIYPTTVSDYCKIYNIDIDNYKKPSEEKIKELKEKIEALLNKYKGYGVIKAVAKELDVSDDTIYFYCKKYNINIDNYTKPTKEELYLLLDKYKGYGVTKAIAKELNISPNTVYKYCREYDIDINDYNKNDKISKDKLIYTLSKNNYNIEAVAKCENVSARTIGRLIHDRYHIIIPNHNQLLSLWFDSNFDINIISNKLNISNDAVLDISINKKVIPAIYFDYSDNANKAIYFVNDFNIENDKVFPRFNNLIN